MRQIATSFLALTVAAGVAFPASASIITTTTPSTNPPANGLMSTVAGVTTERFNGTVGTTARNFSGGQIVQGSSANAYAAPNGDTSNYYIVGTPSSFTGTATFTPGGSYSYFGLYWGSIDTYNKISFFNGATDVGDFTGAAFPPATGDNSAPNTNEYVNFFFSPGTSYTSVQLSTSQANFEFDNIAYGNAPVPEPASLALLGAGILGVGMMSRRRGPVGAAAA